MSCNPYPGYLTKCLVVLSRKLIFLLFVLGYSVHLCTNQTVILSYKMGFWGEHDSEALLACISLCTTLKSFILGKLNLYSKYRISDDNANIITIMSPRQSLCKCIFGSIVFRCLSNSDQCLRRFDCFSEVIEILSRTSCSVEVVCLCLSTYS